MFPSDLLPVSVSYFLIKPLQSTAPSINSTLKFLLILTSPLKKIRYPSATYSFLRSLTSIVLQKTVHRQSHLEDRTAASPPLFVFTTTSLFPQDLESAEHNLTEFLEKSYPPGRSDLRGAAGAA